MICSEVLFIPYKLIVIAGVNEVLLYSRTTTTVSISGWSGAPGSTAGQTWRIVDLTPRIHHETPPGLPPMTLVRYLSDKILSLHVSLPRMKRKLATPVARKMIFGWWSFNSWHSFTCQFSRSRRGTYVSWGRLECFRLQQVFLLYLSETISFLFEVSKVSP